MIIEFEDLLENGLFKSADDIYSIIEGAEDDEEISIANIPFVSNDLIVYILNPAVVTRAEPEFFFREEDMPTGSVKYIVCSTKDVATELEGIIILNSTDMEVVLETRYTSIYSMGNRIYCGLLEDSISKMVAIQRTDTLDFTDYMSLEIADIGSFSIDGVKPTQNSEKFVFYIVEAKMEVETEEEYSEYFVLQSDIDIARFVDGLISLAEGDAELEESYMELSEYLGENLAK